MSILINLLKEIAVFLVIAYLFSKTPVFKLLLTKDFTLGDFFTLYIFFSAMAIIGTYFGIPVEGAIANNRVIGASIAGLIIVISSSPNIPLSPAWGFSPATARCIAWFR